MRGIVGGDKRVGGAVMGSVGLGGLGSVMVRSSKDKRASWSEQCKVERFADCEVLLTGNDGEEDEGS